MPLENVLPQLDVDADAEIDVDAILDEVGHATYGLNPVFVFDLGETGYATSGSATALVLTDTQLSLLTWVEKCLRTRRGVYPIYGEDYGTDLAHLIGKVTLAELQSIGTDDLRRGLMVNELIDDVQDVQFHRTPSKDAVQLDFTLVDVLAGDQRVRAVLA